MRQKPRDRGRKYVAIKRDLKLKRPKQK